MLRTRWALQVISNDAGKTSKAGEAKQDGNSEGAGEDNQRAQIALKSVRHSVSRAMWQPRPGKKNP